MNNRMRITLLLLTSITCVSLYAGDRSDIKTGAASSASAEQPSPIDPARQEQLEQIIEVIRILGINHNIILSMNGIELLVQLEKICAQIKEESGATLTPVELFQNISDSSRDTHEWKQFCHEKGIAYMAPVEMFELLSEPNAEKKIHEIKTLAILSTGITIGGIGGVYYADTIKSTLKNGGVFTLAQLIKNPSLITGKLSLTPKQHLGLNICLDTLLTLCEYHAKAHTSINDQIIQTINSTLQNNSDQQPINSNIRIALNHVVTENNKNKLPTLGTERTYTPTKTDYAFLAAGSIASNCILHAPLPQNDTIFLSCGNDDFMILSKNQLLQASKESGKEMIAQFVQSQLSSNAIKNATDATRVSYPSAKDLALSLAQNTAKEISYTSIAQFLHKKVPTMNSNTGALIQTLFPKDGIPKNCTQDTMRLVTIVSATWCAAAGLSFAKTACNWASEQTLNACVGLMGVGA